MNRRHKPSDIYAQHICHRRYICEKHLVCQKMSSFTRCFCVQNFRRDEQFKIKLWRKILAAPQRCRVGETDRVSYSLTLLLSSSLTLCVFVCKREKGGERESESIDEDYSYHIYVRDGPFFVWARDVNETPLESHCYVYNSLGGHYQRYIAVIFRRCYVHISCPSSRAVK